MSLPWPERPIPGTGGWPAPIAWMIPPLLAVIGGIGVATLYSVGGGSMQPWAMTHVTRLIIGFGLLIALALAPAELWRRVAWPVYVVALILVVLVMLRGTQALGAQRWLTLGPLSLQPSETMKLALILVLARFYHDLPARQIADSKAVLIPLALTVVPMLFILRQPDLGTAMLLLATGLGIIVLAGTALQYMAAGGLLVLMSAPFLWTMLHGYQKQRILVFLDPAIDPLGKGYQIYQSKIALGSGGYTGKGFLQGTQSQLDFVPEKQTDFIFALWAEETGFVGSVLLISLFLALIWCIVGLAMRSQAVFARLLISGIAMLLFLHVFVNIAMVVGLAPVVGVPLPLISYGGTSLFSLFMGLGIAISVARSANDGLRATNMQRLGG